MRRQAPATAGLLLLVALAAVSCSGDAGLARLVGPTRTIEAPFPPNSPANVLRLLEWSFNHHSPSQYHELFTADFEYTCAPGDSAPLGWRDTTDCRAPEPSPHILGLTLDRNFFAYPDPYYVYYPPPNGHVLRDPAGRWHRSIRTTVTLRSRADNGHDLETSGHTTFSLVRGDSALIPQELRDRGTRPDSTRWYIRRWDDETTVRLP